MRNFRRSSKGQILLLSAIIVCILLFVLGGLLADASRRRPPRESEDIYFVFENIKIETIKTGEHALSISQEDNGSYVSDWCAEVNVYIQELGYTGSLTYTWNPAESSVDFVLIIQSTDTTLQDAFTVT